MCVCALRCLLALTNRWSGLHCILYLVNINNNKNERGQSTNSLADMVVILKL